VLSQAHEIRERRCSSRWRSGRDLRWRVRRGRIAKTAEILERSLNGLVLEVTRADAPAEGQYVLPADRRIGDRHGFREGIVRRRLNDGRRSVLYVEILA